MAYHTESERLTRAIERLTDKGTEFSAITYRSASPRYANRDDLVTGLGSKSAGARWNPPKSFASVYLSTDPHTALDEVLAHFRHHGISDAEAMPRVIASVELCLTKALDLTDGDIRQILRVSKDRMREEPWREMQSKGREAITQAIGRIAWEYEWEGLVVPSAARRGGENIIVFPANLNPPDSWLRIVNRGELPKRM